MGYAIGSNNTISPKAALGKLIKRFTGKEVSRDQDYNLNEIFDGKKVSFVTVKNNDGYTEVQRDSVKPSEAQ